MDYDKYLAKSKENLNELEQIKKDAESMESTMLKPKMRHIDSEVQDSTQGRKNANQDEVIYKETLAIFELCSDLKRLLGNKKAIANLEKLLQQHNKDGMFDDLQDVAVAIDSILKKGKYPRVVTEISNPKYGDEFMISKKLNEKKMGDVGIHINDDENNDFHTIFHANVKRVTSLNSVLKKKIVAVDGRDAHTPYTQAQSLDGRLVQKNISSTTNDTISNYSLKNTEEILEMLKQENIDLKEYIHSQSIYYPQVTAEILEFDKPHLINRVKSVVGSAWNQISSLFKSSECQEQNDSNDKSNESTHKRRKP